MKGGRNDVIVFIPTEDCGNKRRRVRQIEGWRYKAEEKVKK